MEWFVGVPSWALAVGAVAGARGPACMFCSASPLPFGGCAVGPAAGMSRDSRMLFSLWNAPGTTKYNLTCTVS